MLLTTGRAKSSTTIVLVVWRTTKTYGVKRTNVVHALQSLAPNFASAEPRFFIVMHNVLPLNASSNVNATRTHARLMLRSTNLRFLFTPLVSNAVGIALAARAWCDDLRSQGWSSLASDHLIFKDTTPHAKPTGALGLACRCHYSSWRI